LDFWWHITHNGFETGADQVRAHWLVWLGTILVLAVGIRALLIGVTGSERVGYVAIVGSNLAYIPIAVAHYIQHLNHEEVDWAHVGLAVTNVASALAVLYITYFRRPRPTHTA
jgi:hypothetical protein